MTSLGTTATTALALALMLGAGTTVLGQGMQGQHHPQYMQQAPAQQGMPMQPGMMGQMGPGMMGPGMMGPGMMGPGMMGPDTMGPDMMGPGMMGQMGQGMMAHHGPGMPHGLRVVPMMQLSPDDVRAFLQHHIAGHDLQHLKVGDVEQTDPDTITADLVTENGSLALRLGVDPHTGAVKSIE
jgi:hypothetical protein